MKNVRSSRPGGRNRTKGGITGRASRAEPKTDWNYLRTVSPRQIRCALESDPDIHPTDEAFWKGAKVVMPKNKEVVTMRLDADLLQWLRRERGYQTRVNAVLRAYMNAEER